MSPPESPRHGPPRHGPPRRPGAPPRRLPTLARETPIARADAAERATNRPEPAPPAPEATTRRWALIALRYGLPAVVVVAGLVGMAFGTDTSLEGGAGLVSAGLAIWFINWLFRIGADGDTERDDEERAREYMDRHGHWPDEHP